MSDAEVTCPKCQRALSDDARFCSHCGFDTAKANVKTEIIVARDTGESARPDPLLGKVLDSKYELLERLGRGAAGTVYRARRLHIGDDVVVKVLNQDYLLEKTALERFRREARSAAMIRHPNVVTIHDFSESKPNEPAYIVMEFVRGKSLRELLKQEGRMSVERTATLMRDICAGVGVAHRQGMIHRDLKPDNVIVVMPEFEGDREMAKVVDFGIAKLHDSTTEFNLTQTGALVGTPFYMSPEQWRGEPIDVRSDVYSLGAMLYEMLGGTPPFIAGSLPELIIKQLNDEPPAFVPSLNVPPALERICRSALAKKPEQRPANATVFSREIQSALALGASGFGSSRSSFEQPTIIARSSAVPTLPLTQPKRSSHGIKWIVGGVFALLIFAALAVGAIVSVRRFISNRSAIAANTNSTASQNIPSENPATEEKQTTQNSDSGNASPLTSQAGLIGRWTGTYGPSNNPATLIVRDYKDGKFSGVLEQGEVHIAFTGRVDSKTRRVTMKETQVLRGSGWSLGENMGEISADGRKMSGTGSDAIGGQFGMSYQWSFSK